MLVLRTNFHFCAPRLNHIELLKGKCKNDIQLFIFYKPACPVQKNFRGRLLSILVFFSDGYYCTTLCYIWLSQVSCEKVSNNSSSTYLVLSAKSERQSTVKVRILEKILRVSEILVLEQKHSLHMSILSVGHNITYSY